MQGFSWGPGQSPEKVKDQTSIETKAESEIVFSPSSAEIAEAEGLTGVLWGGSPLLESPNPSRGCWTGMLEIREGWVSIQKRLADTKHNSLTNFCTWSSSTVIARGQDLTNENLPEDERKIYPDAKSILSVSLPSMLHGNMLKVHVNDPSS